jgi:hypothetical protein
MGANGSTANLVAACTSAKVVRSLSDGATLTLEVRDAGKELWRSSLLAATSWVAVDGYHYQLTSMSSGDAGLTLTLDDIVAAKMQAQRAPEVQGGHDPGRGAEPPRPQLSRRRTPSTRARTSAPMKNDLEVNSVDEPDVGVVLGSDRVDRADVGWRRFSDGRRMIAGSDAWLLARSPRSACRARPATSTDHRRPRLPAEDADRDAGRAHGPLGGSPGHGRHARLRRPSERPVARRQRRA